MPITFGFAIFFFVVAAVLLIAWRGMKHAAPVKRTDRRTGLERDVQPYSREAAQGAKWLGAAVMALALFLTLLSSIQIVGTKEIGVVTSFGSTDGHLGNGLGLTWPWENVTEMDGAIQTNTYEKSDAFTIRIANQQTAFPDVTIRWRIVPGQADSLFQNYRTFDNVRDSLVTKELRTALGEQLSSYNPLNSVQYGVPANGAHNPTYGELAQRVRAQMQSEIGSQIEVLSIFMPFVGFDPKTEAKLNQLQEQIAATRIAEQAQQTALAQAKANRDLATSVNRSPNVLVAQCMTYLGDLVKNGQTVPPGFSCWPGGGVSGIIANTTK